MISVHDLRQAGYRVRVFHNRELDKKNKMGGIFSRVSPRGGSTEVEIYDRDRQFGFVGTARCNKTDNYNRKIGVRIALGRALFVMGGYARSNDESNWNIVPFG